MIIRDERLHLERIAAGLIADEAQDVIEERGRVVIALPGGRSVSGVFDHLKDQPLPWKNVHLFMVDERLVELNHPESNFLLVKKHLGDIIPEANLHPFRYNPDAPDKGTKAYEEELKRFGGRFDIVLLSSGEDGHVAGLYPHHHSIADQSEWFITMDDSPKAPPMRMSSSANLIAQAGLAVLLFLGPEKATAFDRYQTLGPIEECPARLIKTIMHTFILTDNRHV